MWFLTRHPAAIRIAAVVVSLPKSYQHTIQRFYLAAPAPETTVGGESAPTSIRVALPFPWSDNKADGSFTLKSDAESDALLDAMDNESGLVTESRAASAADRERSTSITREANDLRIYRKVLGIKNDQEDVNVILVNDLAEKYSWDDWGFMTFEVEPNRWYHISYTHKISVYSTLCVPATLPVNLFYKKVPISVTVYAINGDKRNRQSFMEPLADVNEERLSYVRSAYGIDATLLSYRTSAAFAGAEDINVAVCNWESSDDGEASDANSDDE